MKTVKNIFKASALSGVILAASPAHANYPTFDAAAIQTSIANSAAEVAEMVTTHGLQQQEMVQNALLAAKDMIAQQFNTQAKLMYESQSDTNIANKGIINSLQPASGICVGIDAGKKLKDIKCEVADKKKEQTKEMGKKLSGTSDEVKPKQEQRKELLDKIEKVNKAAKDSGSDLTVATAATAMKPGKSLNKAEQEVVKTAREMMMGLTKTPANEKLGAVGSPKYFEKKVAQLQSAQFKTLAYDGMTYIDHQNAKTENGQGPSQLDIERSLVGQWYGQQPDGTVGPSLHLQVYTNTAPEGVIDPVSGEEASVITDEQVNKEILMLEGIGLYYQQKIYEQNLRMEQLLAATLLNDLQ